MARGRTIGGTLALALAVCGIFAGAQTAAAEPLPAPGGFRLHSSNGYTLEVGASRNPKTGSGIVFMFVRGHDSQVLYVAPAVVTDTSMKADLGSVGSVDVGFVASGEARTDPTSCGEDQAIVDSGSYAGTIDFRGEEGYSEVRATGARGSLNPVLRLICSGGVESEGTGGHSPGARLRARRGGRRFEFEARKNSPTRPARFVASISERRGSLGIFRVVRAMGGPGAFRFDVPSQHAQVDPPAPFAGGAMYDRGPGAIAAWDGDLSVDFPGRSDVRLSGSGTRASLIRAVQNPGHPFRIP